MNTFITVNNCLQVDCIQYKSKIGIDTNSLNTVNSKILASKNFRVTNFWVKMSSDASVCPKMKNTDNF